jgi:hypothetical protein
MSPRRPSCNGRRGLIDGKKVFDTDLTLGTDIFDMPGIGLARGGSMVVESDRCTAYGLPPRAHKVLAELFARFMLRC